MRTPQEIETYIESQIKDITNQRNLWGKDKIKAKALLQEELALMNVLKFMHGG